MKSSSATVVPSGPTSIGLATISSPGIGSGHLGYEDAEGSTLVEALVVDAMQRSNQRSGGNSWLPLKNLIHSTAGSQSYLGHRDAASPVAGRLSQLSSRRRG